MSKKKTKTQKNLIYKIGLGLSILIFVFALATSKVNAVISVISPSTMQGWIFEINSPDGFGTFVSGPGTAPLGTGSVRLFSGTNGNLSIAFQNPSFLGTALADITNLQYSAYANTQNGASKAQPFMIMSVQTDAGTDVLTFDPNGQSTSAQFQSWQHWNVKDDGVWDSNFDPDTESLSEYIAYMNAAYGPNITINSIKFQVGPGSELDVFDGNVDNFTIGVNGGDVTYDFEPNVTPSPAPSVNPSPSISPSPSPSFPINKEQCKNGGWNTFRNPAFANQGHCVSFVQTGKS